jgi:ADP-ribose pyrophosphatase YjhB (NUDIX family)
VPVAGIVADWSGPVDRDGSTVAAVGRDRFNLAAGERAAVTGTSPNYCPECGTELGVRRVEGRDRPYCPACDAPVYRNAKPCAGVLVVRDDELLMVRRTNPPSVGAWSVPAGYLEHDEPPVAAAVRELREETAVRADPDAVELLGTRFVDHPDGWHVLVLVYAAAREATEGTPEPGSDAGDARFLSLSAFNDSDARVEPGYRPLLSKAVSRFGGV